MEFEIARMRPQFGFGDVLKRDRVVVRDVDDGIVTHLLCVLKNFRDRGELALRQAHDVVAVAGRPEVGDRVLPEVGFVPEIGLKHEGLVRAAARDGVLHKAVDLQPVLITRYIMGEVAIGEGFDREISIRRADVSELQVGLLIEEAALVIIYKLVTVAQDFGD